MIQMGATILKYDMAKHHLTVIDPPESYDSGIFIVPTEDDLLGEAGIRGTPLNLWSRKANAEGVVAWIQYRVIELRTLLPVFFSSRGIARISLLIITKSQSSPAPD
jgi:hypothetical protein